MPLEPHLSSEPGRERQDSNSAAPVTSGTGDGSIAPGEKSAGASDLFQSIPRRRQIGSDGTRTSTLSLPPPRTIKPPVFRVLMRVALWGGKLAVFFGGIAVARLFRRSNAREHARHLRRTL